MRCDSGGCDSGRRDYRAYPGPGESRGSGIGPAAEKECRVPTLRSGGSGGRQQGPAGADNAGAETCNRPANRRSGRRSAASLFLSEHSILSLPAWPFFRSFSPFRASDAKLDRPVFILVFFCVLKALEAPETRGNAGKLQFGSAAKPIRKGIFPCSCSGRQPAPRIRSPFTVISTGAPAPGRGGVEKPDRRSVDAESSGVRPAPVASRISPLAPLRSK